MAEIIRHGGDPKRNGRPDTRHVIRTDNNIPVTDAKRTGPETSGDDGMSDRYRLNAKQTARGTWQLDLTVERETLDRLRPLDPNDLGNTAKDTMADTMLQIVRDTETKFRKDGRKIAGDEI